MDIFTNPWIIGIAATLIATVLAGLILYFVFGIGRSAKLQKSPQEQFEDEPMKDDTPKDLAQESLTKRAETASNNTGLIRGLTPIKIIGELDKLPPMQRSAAAQYYKGIKVSWKVCFFTGYPSSSSQIRLMLQTPKYVYPWIYCVVDSNKYPQLKIMKENATFTVEGEIDSVEENVINLRNVSLLF